MATPRSLVQYSRVQPEEEKPVFAYVDCPECHGTDDEKERSFGKSVSRSRSQKSGGGKRTRDSGYTVMEEHHYRTHIFLSPTGSFQQQGSYDRDADAAGPPNKSSLMKWSVGGTGNVARRRRSDSIPDTPTTSASRQVSFNRGHGKESGHISSQSQRGMTFAEGHIRSEPITLATLDRDCFIIPVESLDRFLPAGVPMPFTDTQPSQLNVLEVDDPKQCVMIHLMTLMEPIEPLLESPLAKPLAKQRGAASELLAEIGQSKTAVEGMLLSNIEKNVNKNQHDPIEFFRTLRQSTLQKFDPKHLRYTAHHTLDLFNEVATIARPPLQAGSRRPSTKTTGYIISVYKVFEGDDGEKFEKNWLYWTGARMLYRYLPKSVGLRRITLHKSLSSGDKMYLLLCECSHFLEDLSAAAMLIPALRGRLCGNFEKKARSIPLWAFGFLSFCTIFLCHTRLSISYKNHSELFVDKLQRNWTIWNHEEANGLFLKAVIMVSSPVFPLTSTLLLLLGVAKRNFYLFFPWLYFTVQGWLTVQIQNLNEVFRHVSESSTTKADWKILCLSSVIVIFNMAACLCYQEVCRVFRDIWVTDNAIRGSTKDKKL